MRCFDVSDLLEIVFQVVHGAERGETAALFLSPLRSANKNMSGADVGESGSQFTFFLTAPLLAFSQLVGLSSSSHNEVWHVSLVRRFGLNS